MTLAGVWSNEYGSTMTLVSANPNFLFGTYQSTTGSTGTYQVIGYQTTAEPTPSAGQAVALAIHWHCVAGGAADNSWHWVSGLSGQISILNGVERLVVAHALVASIEIPGLVQSGVYVDKLTYQRVPTDLRKAAPRNLGTKATMSSMLGGWVGGDGTALIVESMSPHLGDEFGWISGKLTWKGASCLFHGVTDIKVSTAEVTQQSVAIVGLPNVAQGPAIALAGTLDLERELLTLFGLESRSTASDSTYVQTLMSSMVLSRVSG